MANPLPRRAVPAELPAEVVLRARAGHRAAQSEVVARYTGVLRALVRRVAQGSDVDELTQSLLQKLLEALPRFDPKGPAKLTTWVFTLAHHFLIDSRRRARLSLVPLVEAEAVVDSANPHADAERGELRVALEAAIARLPEEQRRVFVLAQLYEHPLDEVARVEGVPVGTVKSRLFRARASLAMWLGPRLQETSS